MSMWTVESFGVDVWFGDELFTLVDPGNDGVTVSSNGLLPPRATCWCGVDLELILDDGAVKHSPNPDGSAWSATSNLKTPPCEHWT